MIQRLYVNNFRCFENFELMLKDMPSALLIGKNGAGKSTVSHVLKIFQAIGRGVNRVGHLVQIQDAVREKTDIPIRFEIETVIYNQVYVYTLALDLWEYSKKELRVFEEKLVVSGKTLFSRKEAQVNLALSGRAHDAEAQFEVNWHLVALPLIQEQSDKDPLRIFRTWLSQMIILAPIPSLMTGESRDESLEPKHDGSNFGDWFFGLLRNHPAAYTKIDKYLRDVMPDIHDFINEFVGKDSKNMVVRFKEKNTILSLDFNDLSDGEKCYFLCSVVLASNEYYGPLFCFWDEPDNYLSISEVGHFVTSLRRSFNQHGAQLLATSHNEETIRKFSDENTFVLDRKSHLEPTVIRRLSELLVNKESVVDSLIRGDIEL